MIIQIRLFWNILQTYLNYKELYIAYIRAIKLSFKELEEKNRNKKNILSKKLTKS